MDKVFEKITKPDNVNLKSALCIVIESQGSTPRKAGSKMIVYEDGTIFGTIGGGSIEKQVIDDALLHMKTNTTFVKSYKLEEELNMHCGGKMEVYIEPLSRPLNLYIFGAGHIGRVVAKYAHDFGFSPFLIDNRTEIIEQIKLPGCKLLNKDYFEAIEELEYNTDTFIVILTHKHIHDEDILAKVAKKTCKYVGMIGSKTKVTLARKRFIDEKILTEQELTKVDMPIGIKFNAQTPEEIAISIIAKLIDVKNS